MTLAMFGAIMRIHCNAPKEEEDQEKYKEFIVKSVINWNKMKNRNHKMIKTVKLKSIKLDTLLNNNNINTKDFDHWIMDLQGAELLALKGGENSLKNCKSIFIEVSLKSFYSNGSNWDEIKNWLAIKNFYPIKLPKKDEEDILFLKKL